MFSQSIPLILSEHSYLITFERLLILSTFPHIPIVSIQLLPTIQKYLFSLPLESQDPRPMHSQPSITCLLVDHRGISYHVIVIVIMNGI